MGHLSGWGGLPLSALHRHLRRAIIRPGRFQNQRHAGIVILLCAACAIEQHDSVVDLRIVVAVDRRRLRVEPPSNVVLHQAMQALQIEDAQGLLRQHIS